MTISSEAQTAIAEEEAALSDVVDKLRNQLGQSEHKLKIERSRARDLTSQIVAARRDEDKAMLASDEAVAHAMSKKKSSDIEIIQKLLEKPYFARVVVEEQRRDQIVEMEYKLGFSANPDCRIVDWRSAPISKLYYEYKEGEEYDEEIQGQDRSGVIKLRNAVEIDHEQLCKISCRHGHFVRKNDAWEERAQHGRSRSLHTGGSYGELPDILALITQEQFKTITEDAETAVLIQGIAGSGKTTVALHRLAWLLHEDNSGLQPNECMVVALSAALQSYIAQSLQVLKIHGVRVVTYPTWSQGIIGKILPNLLHEDKTLARPSDPCPTSIVRLKGSLAMLRALESSEATRDARELRQLEQKLPWDQLPAGLRSLIDEAQAKPETQKNITQKILAGIDRGLAALNPNHPRYQGLHAARSIAQAIGKRDYRESIQDLLRYPETILEQDESRLLDRQLIDTARERSDRNWDQGVLDYCDDALVIRLAQLRGASMHPTVSSGKYGHIVIDETQDFSTPQLATLIGAVDRIQQLTLVGDTAQQLQQTGSFLGWDKLRKYWNFSEDLSQFISLKVSHRSTRQIMRLAEYVQGQDIIREGRDGRVPIWFKCNGEGTGVRAAIGWLEKALERYPDGLTAVLCHDNDEAKYAFSLLQPSFGPAVRYSDEFSFSFEEGLVVSSVKAAKGLEFLNVLLWNPARKHYGDSAYGKNLLYIGMTRAEENLCLVSWNRPSPHLPHIHAKILRGIELGFEEELDSGRVQ